MENLIVGLIIIAILAGASYKIYWNKKHNVKCSGCSGCGGACGTHENDK